MERRQANRVELEQEASYAMRTEDGWVDSADTSGRQVAFSPNAGPPKRA